MAKMAAKMNQETVFGGDFDSQGDPPGGCLVAAENSSSYLKRLTPAGVGGFLLISGSLLAALWDPLCSFWHPSGSYWDCFGAI